jgi:hypothetical protein
MIAPEHRDGAIYGTHPGNAGTRASVLACLSVTYDVSSKWRFHSMKRMALMSAKKLCAWGTAGLRRGLNAVFGLVVVLQLTVLSAKGELVTVSATSVPWEWVNGGLNTDFQWGSSGYQPPAVVARNTSAGISLTPGDALTISYVSGTWTNEKGNPFWDAGGYNFTFASPADAHDSGNNFPGIYFPLTDFPYHGGDLDGVFTNAAGGIIGNPFPIGDLRTVIVPSGATQLQMGMDDTYYGDNVGSVTMSVTETSAVPEPASLTLLAVGAVGAMAYAWRWRKQAGDEPARHIRP